MADKVWTLSDLREMEKIVGTVSYGMSDPDKIEFADDVPQYLIDAMRDLYEAKQKLLRIMKKEGF